MIKILLTLVIGLGCQGLLGQTVKILEYSAIYQPKSEDEAEKFKQSLSKNMGSSESSAHLLKSLFTKNHLHTSYFHQDSSLSLHYVDGELSPFVGFKFGGSGGSINLKNGEIFYINPSLIQKTVDKTFGKGQVTIENGPSKDEILKRLSRKEMIDNYECETWELLQPRYQAEVRYWVWKEKTDLDLSKPSLYSFQGKLVVKSVEHNTQYGTDLQVLSLNYGDSSFGKIQNVLDKLEPNWPQAYSSHRIYRLINKEHAYPTMLLIDQNRKIVLQGKPDLSFTAIRNFLDENLK